MKTWTGPFYLGSMALTLAVFVAVLLPVQSPAAEAPPLASEIPPPVEAPPVTNQVDQTLQTRRLLESMQRDLQHDLETRLARNTEAITSSLAQIEPALNRIRQQQADASATANRTILIAAGLFAVAGFFGLGFLTMASVRAMGRFTDVAVHATSRKPLPVPGDTAIEPAEGSFKPAVSGTVEQASARFQGALEQLERRIKELEHTSHPSAAPAPVPAMSVSSNGQTLPALPAETAPATSGTGTTRVEMQLGKGQALLNLDQVTEALTCFDSALSEEPDNTDALLRKGMALEKLQDWERALDCYDRVIHLDASLTVAYLYKGGVCNRLERHREALESYEHALRSERSRSVSP